MRLRSPAEGGSALQTISPPIDRSSELAGQIALVQQAGHDLGFATDHESALRIVATALRDLTGVRGVASYLTDRGGMNSRRQFVLGIPEQLVPARLHLPASWQTDVSYGELRDGLLGDAQALQDEQYITYTTLPLTHGAIFLGVLVLLSSEPGPAGATLDLARLLTSQLAGFLDGRELFTVLEDYALEMAQLAHLTRISTASPDLARLTTDMIRLLGEMTRAEVLIAVREGDQLRLFDHDGPGSTMLNLSAVPDLLQLAQPGQPTFSLFNRPMRDLSPDVAAWIGERRGSLLYALPLVVNQRHEGFLLLTTSSSGLDQRAPVLEMAANQIALQINNARGYQRLQDTLHQRLNELALIEDMGRRITTVLNVDEIAAQVLRAALTATGADAAVLTLANEEGHTTTTRLERNGSDNFTIRHLPGSDARRHGANPDAASYTTAPILRDNETLGNLSVESDTPQRFTTEHTSFLASLAGHAGISLENARLLEERQTQIVALRNLQALAIELSGAESTQDVAHAAIDAAMEMLGADEGALYAVDPASGVVTLIAARSAEGPVRHRASLSRAAQYASRRGEIQARSSARSHRSTVSLPIHHAMHARRYALSLYFSHERAVSQRDEQNLIILTSYVAGQLVNTALNEQVRSASSRMRTILDTTLSGILMLDRAGDVVEVNRAAERLLGLDRETALGKHISAVFMGLSTSGGVGLSQTAISDFARRLRENPELSAERRFERSMSGVSQYITEQVSPVRNDTGKVIGHLLVYHDVTEQARNAQYRDQVTHMVIHDLRGPLWSIMSGLDLAQEDLRAMPDAEPTLRLMEIAINSAQNLMRLVESLLDISRLELGQFPLNRVPASPSDLIEAACTALSGVISEAPITLTMDCDAALPLIDVDQDLIRRVLINLIDNALRHTPMQGQILVRAYARRGDIIFLVADTGPGIPPDQRERIFEQYRQVPQNRPLRGSKGQGLGLAFCKLAVEAHGGRIVVEPHGPLSGAVFSVSMPIWRGD